jgi:hypothetical protein
MGPALCPSDGKAFTVPSSYHASYNLGETKANKLKKAFDRHVKQAGYDLTRVPNTYKTRALKRYIRFTTQSQVRGDNRTYIYHSLDNVSLFLF